MGTKNIIDAIRENDPIKLHEALEFFKYCTKEDYDLNQIVQKNGQRLLHLATKYGSETAFLYLLDTNIDINITDDDGNTPAHYAIFYGQPKILELLKEVGADFSKKNNDGYTLERYIQIRPKKEENKRIKKELENILEMSPLRIPEISNNQNQSEQRTVDTSALTMLANVAMEQVKTTLKRENLEQKEIHHNKIQAIKSSFFHNLPREFEYQTEPLDLSITSGFKK